jgi:hypothetical protein
MKRRGLSGSPQLHRDAAEAHGRIAARYANKTATARSCKDAIDAYVHAADEYGKFQAHAEQARAGGRAARIPETLLKEDMGAARKYLHEACRRK